MTSTLKKTQREAKIDGEIKNCAGKQFATLPQTTLSVAGFRSDNGMCFNSFHCLQSSNGSLWSPKILKYRRYGYPGNVLSLDTYRERAHQFSGTTEHFGTSHAHTTKKTCV